MKAVHRDEILVLAKRAMVYGQKDLSEKLAEIGGGFTTYDPEIYHKDSPRTNLEDKLADEFSDQKRGDYLANRLLLPCETE